MVLTRKNELIKCKECGLIFSADNAEVCWKCREHICPKCGACGCWPPQSMLLSKEERNKIFQDLWHDKIWRRGINLPPTLREFAMAVKRAAKAKQNGKD